MKILLVGIFTISLLSCDQVVKKEPIKSTRSDSVTNEADNRLHQVKQSKLENENEFLIDSVQLMHLNMSFAIDTQYRIAPKMEMQSVKNYIRYQKGDADYFMSENSAYSFSDTLILSGVGDGVLGSSILTIWKKEEDKYRFITVLDRSLITYAYIDSVVYLSKNKYLLAGITEWGYGRDGAGSIWFGVWELPRSFKMIYYDKWSPRFNEYKHISYNYSISNDTIILEKLVVNYKSSDFYSADMHTDWKASRSIINIDLSSKKDLTSDFNRIRE